jgi:hypothetical protein
MMTNYFTLKCFRFILKWLDNCGDKLFLREVLYTIEIV